MLAVGEVDEAKGMTELAGFMLTAVGCDSSLESTFRLLRTFPPAILCFGRTKDRDIAYMVVVAYLTLAHISER